MTTNGGEQNRIYLDIAAATPLSSLAREAMLPYLDIHYGNASAIHEEGRKAKEALKESRQMIATVLGVRPDEIIFTGSGTEANNLAVLGYVQGLAATGRDYSSMEVVMSAIEHPSLLNLIPVLHTLGVKVMVVPVDETGVITKTALTSVLGVNTVLVTFAYANSEIGTVQAVSRLAKVVRAFAKEHALDIKVHVDGAQAPLWLPCQLAQLGVDSLTLDAGKCYGPKGAGMLFVRHRPLVAPLLIGGGQEGGVRPGTENVAGIVGMAVALREAQSHAQERSERVAEVRDIGLTYLTQVLPLAQVNGALGNARIANNINFSLPGVDTEYLVVWLDRHGVAASTKSACAGAGGGMSHVVLACTQDEVRARATIRLTFDEAISVADLRKTIDIVGDFYQRFGQLTQ